MRPTLFEFAGGEPAFLRLATEHHRRCLADPELNHPFSHADLNPHHVERLAAYWAEVLGGPDKFSRSLGDETAVVRLHSGHGDMSDLSGRFLECFMHALDDAELPADVQFRDAMRAYMTWAVAEMNSHPDGDDDVPEHKPLPKWSWEGLVD